jgi:hypothetical protein
LINNSKTLDISKVLWCHTNWLVFILMHTKLQRGDKWAFFSPMHMIACVVCFGAYQWFPVAVYYGGHGKQTNALCDRYNDPKNSPIPN